MKERKNILSIKGDRGFNTADVILLSLILIVVLYPLYFVVIASFSNQTMVAMGEVWFFPKGITLDAYRRVFEREDIWRGFANSFAYTAGSVIVGLFLVMTAAFPLSFQALPFRKKIMKVYMFVMYFGGGMVPSYMWFRQLGLVNSPILVILLGSFSVYNTIIAISFLTSTIPGELYEATEIDGGSYLRMFTHVTLPLSKAILAVLVLYIAVAQWNSYYTPMIYLSKQEYKPLALVLRTILQSTLDSATAAEDPTQMYRAINTAEQMKYAVIIVASIPIIMLYPFIQRYFIQGVMIGAIKG